MEDSCDDDDEKRIEFQYMTAPYRYRPSLSRLHSTRPSTFLNCPFNPFGFSVGCCRLLCQNGERLLRTAHSCAL